MSDDINWHAYNLRNELMRIAVLVETQKARITELEDALHAAIVDLDQCALKTEIVTGELMTWRDSRRIANRAAIAARKALEKSE